MALRMTSGAVRAPAVPRSLWIARPWIDLVIGCGGWSLPLLAVAYGLSGDAERTWAASFYSLALVVNYPHYMATVYRAYRGGEWRRHAAYTVWLTAALIAVGAVAHVETWLIPLVFTTYVMWSPWHYSGQNYGLLMMFARRGGFQISRGEQRWLRVAFVASYVMLLASFNGPSSDPMVRSATLPPAIIQPIGGVALAVFLAGGGWLAFRLVQQRRDTTIAPPLTLLATQALWFVAPAFAAIFTGLAAPQTRYSTGILALMHSAQYLWITQHFARRDQAGQWSAARYWFAVIAGGMALFLPVPWLASTLAHLDFTSSVLIVTAIVNIHHFMIDGVVWKMRDPRVAAALTTDDAAAVTVPAVRWPRGREAAMAIAAIVLVALAALDQWRYRLALRDSDPDALQRAVALNPYDAAAQTRLLKVLVDAGSYDAARGQLDALIAAQPRNAEARVNAGVLARRTGRVDEAIAHWQRALDIGGAQPQVHLYLAEALQERGRASDAVPHYQVFLESLTRDAADARQQAGVVAAVVLKFGDALEQSGRVDDARAQFGLAARIARQQGQRDIEEAAQQRLAQPQ
jgi:hypothetical protein